MTSAKSKHFHSVRHAIELRLPDMFSHVLHRLFLQILYVRATLFKPAASLYTPLHFLPIVHLPETPAHCHSILVSFSYIPHTSHNILANCDLE